MGRSKSTQRTAQSYASQCLTPDVPKWQLPDPVSAGIPLEVSSGEENICFLMPGRQQLVAMGLLSAHASSAFCHLTPSRHDPPLPPPSLCPISPHPTYLHPPKNTTHRQLVLKGHQLVGAYVQKLPSGILYGIFTMPSTGTGAQCWCWRPGGWDPESHSHIIVLLKLSHCTVSGGGNHEDDLTSFSAFVAVDKCCLWLQGLRMV